MNPDELSPQHADYTAIAVQLGVLQEGQRNTLSGIEEIKTIVSTHGEDIGDLKSEVAVLQQRVASHDDQLKQQQTEARPVRGLIWSIISSVSGLAVVVFFVLDRFYLSSH